MERQPGPTPGFTGGKKDTREIHQSFVGALCDTDVRCCTNQEAKARATSKEVTHQCPSPPCARPTRRRHPPYRSAAPSLSALTRPCMGSPRTAARGFAPIQSEVCVPAGTWPSHCSHGYREALRHVVFEARFNSAGHDWFDAFGVAPIGDFSKTCSNCPPVAMISDRHHSQTRRQPGSHLETTGTSEAI